MSNHPVTSQTMKFEVVVIPVTDVDRSKDVYKTLDGDRFSAPVPPKL